MRVSANPWLMMRLSLLALLTACCGLSAQAPSAIFFDTSFNFGRVVRGSVVEHDFIVENRGSASLRILKTSMTPPLLATRLPARVAPGAQGALRFRLDTIELDGPFNGRIVVFLNDPKRPIVQLWFRGGITTTVEILPEPVLRVAAPRGRSSRGSVEIINLEAAPFRILRIDHSGDRFTTRVETIEPGRRYRLVLTLKPDGPGGENTETLLLHTSSPTTPTLRVIAHTALLERVFATPGRVELGSLSLAAIRANPDLLRRFKPIVTVHQIGGADFQVEARTDLPFLVLRLTRAAEGNRYRITISLTAEKLRRGTIQGSIFIFTNDPEFSELTVPVSGLVVER